MSNASQLLTAALENEGVDRIFGVLGEENLDVVEALRRSKIELVLTRHEQSAAFMAATYGRLTSRTKRIGRSWLLRSARASLARFRAALPVRCRRRQITPFRAVGPAARASPKSTR